LGVVDPIPELSELALKENLFLHVDAAFGGFVLPFLRDLGYNVPDFDFAIPGVCSMTIDPHKMGCSCIPAGGILFRNENLRKSISRNISYLSGGDAEQATIVGTRSGASAIAVWSLMQSLGRQGYDKIIKECMRLTFNLVEEIEEIKGLSVVTEPTMNVVGLTSRIFDIHRIAKALRLRKWAISVFPHHIRIVVMPHVRQRHIEEFVKDLTEITNTMRK
jgi:tyrosine decarboxylase/aspartate 1-decarboxylase